MYLKRTHKEFKIGDHFYLLVKLKKISLKLESCAKLPPKFCGLFEVLDRVGIVSYRIELPTNMNTYNVFHFSLVKIYFHDPNHIIDWNVIQVELEGEIQVESTCILDWKETILWNRSIGQVKVQWNHLGPNEVMWEMEDAM